MKIKNKILGALTALAFLIPGASFARTINGNLDVGGGIVGALQTPGAYGLVLTLASGELKIRCTGDNPSSPADCSATNYGYVVAKGTTPGTFQAYKITSSPTFQDDAHATDSDFVGSGTCSWGTTASVAWGEDLPFLIGFVHDGTNGYFVFTRGPVLDSGASSNIGYKDVCPSSADQGNVIAWTTTNVTSTHANQPITFLGSGRFQKSSSDDWTFSTLDDGDGVGIFYNFGVRLYTMPSGQMGAASGKYLENNGGVAPVFTTNNYLWSLGMDGYFNIHLDFASDGGTDGSGSVDAFVSTPLQSNLTGVDNCSSVFDVSGPSIRQIMEGRIAGGTSHMGFIRNTSTTAITGWQNSNMTAGNRGISGSLSCKAF